MSAYRVCVPTSALEALDYKTDADTATRKWRATAITPRCTEGTYLISGGAGVPNKDASDAEWANAGPPPESENTWLKASAINNGFTGAKITVHAFALCGRFADDDDGGQGADGRGGGGGDSPDKPGEREN